MVVSNLSFGTYWRKERREDGRRTCAGTGVGWRDEVNVFVEARTDWIVEGIVKFLSWERYRIPDVVKDVHRIWEDRMSGWKADSVVVFVVCRHWFIFCHRWRCRRTGHSLASFKRLARPDRRPITRQLPLQHLHRVDVECRWSMHK